MSEISGWREKIGRINQVWGERRGPETSLLLLKTAIDQLCNAIDACNRRMDGLQEQIDILREENKKMSEGKSIWRGEIHATRNEERLHFDEQSIPTRKSRPAPRGGQHGKEKGANPAG